MTKIIIPQLDANLVDVTITRWRKQVGDAIAAGEIVADLTTDKAAYELESPASGTLLAVIAAEKSIVLAGSAIGVIGEPGEEVEREGGAGNPAREDSGRQECLPSLAPRAPRVRATPRARRLAQEKGLDLAAIQAETGAEIIDETVLAPYL
ncbi:MAG: E3 binding domain-containing protein [Kiritimatiellaeota bacterium]|nr:E3 binding domain-containing protein [Kiritimatiellota bacterium]